MWGMNIEKLPKLNTYHLIVFYYVARERSISLAAEKLCLTQPTVTSHIKSLERDLNLKLLEIDRQRVILTTLGEGLFPYAREIYKQAVAAEQYIELNKERTICVGASILFISAISLALNLMNDRFSSSIRYQTRFGDAFNLVQEVTDSKMDLAIVPNFDYGNDRLSRLRISDGLNLVFYASPMHPIFKKGLIEWDDLYSYQLILAAERPDARPIFFKRIMPFAPDIAVRLDSVTVSTNSISFCREWVQNGKGVGIDLKKNIEKEIVEGQLKVIPLPENIWVEADAVVHRDNLVSPMVRNFISCVKESIQTLHAEESVAQSKSKAHLPKQTSPVFESHIGPIFRSQSGPP
jgi:DNA-binding transcriptional LysR family regulator